MAYFKPDYLEFFKELAGNNHKEWFDIHRKRYEQSVKIPMQVFVKDLILTLNRFDKEIQIEPKDAIFRINRDIRFSKDKSPYKLHSSAVISKYGKKDKSYPGLYIELGPEYFGIYGGLYMPDSKEIQDIRTYIADHQKEFSALINEADFIDKYGEIKGEKNQRIPKEFTKIAEEIPLIMNKQWYYFAHLDPETILGEDLIDIVVDYYSTAKGMRDFLIKAIHLK
ncbi:MAG: DUF2461 domain-containing protein [Lutimonas sp.]|jgi:uncharacterized protein (TIGR02453 family)